MYDSNVKQVITAKLKLKTTPEQQEALRAIQLAYRATLNAVSRCAFEQGKTNRYLPCIKAWMRLYAQRLNCHPSWPVVQIRDLIVMSFFSSMGPLLAMPSSGMTNPGKSFISSSRWSLSLWNQPPHVLSLVVCGITGHDRL